MFINSVILVLLTLTHVSAEVYDCVDECKNCTLRKVNHLCSRDYTVINSVLYRNNICIPSGTSYMLTNCTSSDSYCVNKTLSYCSNSKLLISEYESDNCTGAVQSQKYKLEDQCMSMQSQFCVQLSEGRDSIFIAIAVFSLYIGICFSVFSSLPCIIFYGGDRRQKYIEKNEDEIIADDTVAIEIRHMIDRNGPGSPSTVSEYSTSTFRGNAILTASCLVGATCLIFLHSLAGAIEGNDNSTLTGNKIKWWRISCYLLVSLVGFFPSSPPSSIREKTSVLWCAFGNKMCGGKFGTSIIQDAVHMLSFFFAIIVFIISEIVEYGREYRELTGYSLGTGRSKWYSLDAGDYGEINPVVYVMIICLVILIALQAPINISKCDALSRLRCSRIENKKKSLNYFAAGAFLIETVMAVLLVAYCTYEESLPIARCTLSSEMIYFSVIVLSTCCVIGYIAGVIFAVYTNRS